MIGLVIGIWIWQMMIYYKLSKICDLLNKAESEEN